MMSDISVLLLDTIRYLKFSEDSNKKTLAESVKEFVEEDFNEHAEPNPAARFYYTILVAIMDGQIDIDNQSDVSYALLKYKDAPAVKNDPDILEQLKMILNSDKQETSKKINNIARRIKNYLLWAKGNKSIKNINSKNFRIKGTDDEEKQKDILNDILLHAKELVKSHEASVGDYVSDSTDFIDMANKDSIKSAIEKHREKRQMHKFKTGLQGLNEILDGGFDQGEFAGFGALSHHFKSEFLMSLARWICVHNSPGVPVEYIPTVVFISLENEIFENLVKWFRTAYVNAFHTSPDDLSDDEVVDYMTEVYAKKGFRLLVFRRIGEEFGWREFAQLIEELEHAGYYIVSCLFDYMSLMKLPDEGANDAKRFQNMLGYARDFANHKNIFTATGLQLSGEAEGIANSGQAYIAKKFNGSHLADCKAAKRELDCLFFLHIEKNHDKIPFLTIAWNKRRYYNPPKKQFTAYQFTDTGLMDDIGGEDQSIDDIYVGRAKTSNAKKQSDDYEDIII